MRVEPGWEAEEVEIQRTRRARKGREREVEKGKKTERKVLEKRGESMRWARIEFSDGGWRAG